MSKPFFIKTVHIIAALFLICAPAIAAVQNTSAQSNPNRKNIQGKAKTGGKSKIPARKGPIVITSDTLSADQNAHIAVFDGRVSAKNDDMELFADKMTVHYFENGGVDTIDAEGNVKLIKEGRVVTAGKAHYEKANDRILFTENPKIAQASSVVTGSLITYYVSTDKMDVKDSKVFIESK